MKRIPFLTSIASLGLLLLLAAGCATMPGGVAPSSTPINGRTYTELGPATGTDSRILILGILPLTGMNTTREAVQEAIGDRDGDALINVTSDAYASWWILWTKNTTRVEGVVIKFDE